MTTLAQGLAVLGHGEIHAVACRAIDAIRLQKAKAGLRRFHPLGALAVQSTKTGKHPRAPALHPYALIGGIDLAGAIQAGVHTAMYAVYTVFQPKIHTALQLLANPGARLLQFLKFHFLFPQPVFRLTYSPINSPSITSTIDSIRGRWKGPLKVEPLVEGMVGSPSRRR